MPGTIAAVNSLPIDCSATMPNTMSAPDGGIIWPERAARRHRAGGQRVRVAAPAHLRQGDETDGGRGGEARAIDRAEAGAAGDGGNREAAAAMAEETRRHVEEIAAGIGRETQMRHQHEQGQRAQLIARHGLEQQHAGLDQRRLQAEGDREPAPVPTSPSDDADGHSGQQQCQQDDARPAMPSAGPVIAALPGTCAAGNAAAASTSVTRR